MSNSDYYEKDFYATLGVPDTASEPDVKKAYRKLAQQLHPDANPDKSAEERFKEVGRAYSVLSDPKKRAEYDEARRLVRSGGFPGGMGGTGFPDFGQGGYPGGTRIRVEDLGDLGGLGDLFGGLFNRGQPRPTRRRGRDVTSEVTLGFEEAVRGATVPLQLRGPAPCATCAGTGAKPGTLPKVCPTCEGRGTVASDQGLFGLSRPCPSCNGRGTVIPEPCPTCRGSGIQTRTRELRVRIPAGVKDGGTIRLRGQGEPGVDGAPPGDLNVKVHVRPHPLFGRRGNDLTVMVPVTLPEAALGAELKVPTLDGPVTLKVPGGTQSGRTFRVKGRGVPAGKRPGDLLVTVTVAVPQRLSRKEKELLKELAALQDESPRAHLGVEE